jgi:CRISPR-associated protein Cas1
LPIAQRVSFVYLDRCVIHRDSNAIVAMDESGETYLPGASIGVLLLGPGTRITHQAMNLLGDSGVVTCWVGEGGARLYASAPALSRSTELLEAQARLVSNRLSRLAVARSMYQLRFPGEDVSQSTMQQLRGMEGARVRRAYREAAQASGVEWKGRHYDPARWASGDAVNRALSVANTCLYGIAHSAIVALGCSTGLGFVHTGHILSFVYDVADLYKADVTIPAAFSAAAEGEKDLASRVRRSVRERVYDLRLPDRAVEDIRRLLLGDKVEVDVTEGGMVALWDDEAKSVSAGINYEDS